MSGTGAQSPGQVPARRVSLSSCLGFVQDFKRLALLVICFPLSHGSGLSLELVAGTSPACLGGVHFPAPGSTRGGRRACEASTTSLHQWHCPGSISRATSKLCPWLLPLRSSPCQPHVPDSSNKAEGEGFKCDAGLCTPGLTSSCQDVFGHPLWG